MRIPVLVGCLLLICPLFCYAQHNVFTTDGSKTSNTATIARAFPAEYAAYERSLSKDNDTSACLVLLSKVRESLRKSPPSQSEYKGRARAYEVTWSLCLRTMLASKDQASRQAILDRWNEGLAEDDDAVPSQIYSLWEDWDRSLLTDKFWRLLKKTDKKRTISAIAYVLYPHGNAEDAQRLTEKEESGIDVGLQVIIQNALNYMNWRLRGDPTDPGPAGAPPRRE